MAKSERFDCDNLSVTGGTSFSQLLFADDNVLGLDVNQIFRCNNNNNNNASLFSAEKTPRMLCFEKFPNRGERAFSGSTQKSGVTCSDSSSSASSSNNNSVSTMSESNRKRNGSNQESVQCASTVTTTTCIVPNQRTSSKKFKTENPTTNVPAKKRKEKLGERITALQHLVSPFGKTDTASVLHEAMGYIRFLQEQVQVLCSPYLQRLPSSLPDKEGGGGGENGVVGGEGKSKDLRSRGLCLIPVECTVHVANTNGADLWSPAMASNVSSSTKQ
ncbi:Myc-type, basic helix-loop-helix (bHLH) domain containing protein [Parasponia andersonii]|uniref:Myc-type, basic helix-loop-helix (BHLH) domain containing protein n=1 Tax=Parasponia andersonii TaxID=3476 RepID=A0A2P5DN67_PARAD|nr:Myc-type, basic helix-loop-helix (bHLH) domain containing protein [Parasponia andersonii]